MVTITLFGFFRLVRVPLKLVLLTLPEKLSPTAGHGFSYLNDSGMTTFIITYNKKGGGSTGNAIIFWKSIR